MVAESSPIPDRPGYYTRAVVVHQCNGCGSRQERFNKHGILCCAYCGGSKAPSEASPKRMPVVPQPQPALR